MSLNLIHITNLKLPSRCFLERNYLFVLGAPNFSQMFLNWNFSSRELCGYYLGHLKNFSPLFFCLIYVIENPKISSKNFFFPFFGNVRLKFWPENYTHFFLIGIIKDGLKYLFNLRNLCFYDYIMKKIC